MNACLGRERNMSGYYYSRQLVSRSLPLCMLVYLVVECTSTVADRTRSKQPTSRQQLRERERERAKEWWSTEKKVSCLCVSMTRRWMFPIESHPRIRDGSKHHWNYTHEFVWPVCLVRSSMANFGLRTFCFWPKRLASMAFADAAGNH